MACSAATSSEATSCGSSSGGGEVGAGERINLPGVVGATCEGRDSTGGLWAAAGLSGLLLAGSPQFGSIATSMVNAMNLPVLRRFGGILGRVLYLLVRLRTYES